MTKIAITGAAGNVGRVLLDGFADHEVTPLTFEETDDLDSIVCDITDREAFVDALDGQDVLIHLAGNPSPYAEWDDLKEPNIDGVYNAYHAAIENDLDRVVFASSNHAVNMDDISDPTEPETMAADAPTVYPGTAGRPDSFYGVSKVAGEALGDFFSKRYDIEAVSLRIGWLMTEDELEDSQDTADSDYPEDAARFGRAMWLSHRDCRDVFESAATAEVPHEPLVVHGISRNDDRYLSLTETQRTIGYRPRDNASETLEN
ncbi:NAD-dependent epimerase/dehydratase family protein [Halococcus hamelinensis]|uniref:NAD-dependent epimerase/dehydratase n=1 Tax=Halococcus hamelinensis 100A6 TaxID=1132509 RepID=M0M4P3_9EURY|nr:NAD(P)-dependent oxidoreductase [Halococcus hamelinensis]EMA39579.1 NAD-dependent epimerase/dehydratase [Halococcus hamelinensis 100A6]